VNGPRSPAYAPTRAGQTGSPPARPTPTTGTGLSPAGAIDLGESVAQGALRETYEDPGSESAITGISGNYPNPTHVILYTNNSEARQELSIVLTARPVSGQPTPSRESSEVRWSLTGAAAYLVAAVIASRVYTPPHADARLTDLPSA